MNSYISFDEGVVDNATEIVGSQVEVDFYTLEISLVPEAGDSRVHIPFGSVKRVEVEEDPTFIPDITSAGFWEGDNE